jgi:hypothetical protein
MAHRIGRFCCRAGRSSHICTGTCSLLRAMSAKCSQITHGDVKASNVLVREGKSGWEACISDFGTTATALSVRAIAPIMRAAETLFAAGRRLRCGRHR